MQKNDEINFVSKFSYFYFLTQLSHRIWSLVGNDNGFFLGIEAPVSEKTYFDP